MFASSALAGATAATAAPETADISIRVVGAKTVSITGPSAVTVKIANGSNQTFGVLKVAFQPAPMIVSATPGGVISNRPTGHNGANHDGPGYIWTLRNVRPRSTRLLKLQLQAQPDAQVGQRMGAYLLTAWTSKSTLFFNRFIVNVAP